MPAGLETALRDPDRVPARRRTALLGDVERLPGGETIVRLRLPVIA